MIAPINFGFALTDGVAMMTADSVGENKPDMKQGILTSASGKRFPELTLNSPLTRCGATGGCKGKGRIIIVHRGSKVMRTTSNPQRSTS